MRHHHALALTTFAFSLALAGQAIGQAAPTLPGIINDHLATIPALSKKGGVNITNATYAKGVIRVEGTVARAAQRDEVKAAVEKFIPNIRATLDIAAKTVDVTALTVAPGPLTPVKPVTPVKPATPPVTPATPGTPTEVSGDCWDCWDTVVITRRCRIFRR